MLILNVIALVIVAFGIGFYTGRGQIVIKRVANKKMSEEMLKVEKEQYKELIEQAQEALESYNQTLGGM